MYSFSSWLCQSRAVVVEQTLGEEIAVELGGERRRRRLLLAARRSLAAISLSAWLPESLHARLHALVDLARQRRPARPAPPSAPGGPRCSRKILLRSSLPKAT